MGKSDTLRTLAGSCRHRAAVLRRDFLRLHTSVYADAVFVFLFKPDLCVCCIPLQLCGGRHPPGLRSTMYHTVTPENPRETDFSVFFRNRVAAT